MKKLFKKIQLIHIAIILAICIILIFISYQNFSTKPKTLEINIDEEEIVELPKEYCKIQNISNTELQIICEINKNLIDETNYINYTEGPGIGRKINLSIILKQNNNLYKIKTLKSRENDENIYLVGYIDSKNLLEEYEILLLNNENGKIYQYTGGELKNNYNFGCVKFFNLGKECN